MVRSDCGHRLSCFDLLALFALPKAIWTIALGYLLIEGFEAFSNRQILNLAIFATLDALSSINTARLDTVFPLVAGACLRVLTEHPIACFWLR